MTKEWIPRLWEIDSSRSQEKLEEISREASDDFEMRDRGDPHREGFEHLLQLSDPPFESLINFNTGVISLNALMNRDICHLRVHLRLEAMRETHHTGAVA